MTCPRVLRPVVFALLATACAGKVPPPVPVGTAVIIEPVEAGLPGDWKSIALPGDATWIGLVETAWNSALGEARARRFESAIAAEGPLLEVTSAKPRPAPPPGRYRCRVIKLGVSATGKGAGFAKFKPFYCFVAAEGALLTFTKATGTQRPGGRLWDDGETRLIFLGGVSKGGQPAPYGGDPEHNLAGIVERVDDFRWRLVTPAQGNDARLDVMELIPDTPPPSEPAQ
jgi:Domain of unknown function (DUF4893)